MSKTPSKKRVEYFKKSSDWLDKNQDRMLVATKFKFLKKKES